jgi:hypothetical protein
MAELDDIDHDVSEIINMLIRLEQKIDDTQRQVQQIKEMLQAPLLPTLDPKPGAP